MGGAGTACCMWDLRATPKPGALSAAKECRLRHMESSGVLRPQCRVANLVSRSDNGMMTLASAPGSRTRETLRLHHTH